MNNTHISLRSIDTAVDVSEISKVYNGGGHRNASGIKIPHLISHMGKLIDDGNCYKLLKDIYFEDVYVDSTIEEGQSMAIKCVYMYSPYNKSILAKYLLQRRGIVPIQNCIDINNKLNKEKQDEVSMAVVWSYNPITEITCFVIKFDKDVKEDVKLKVSESIEADIDYPIYCDALQRKISWYLRSVMRYDVKEDE
jgi:hypothetical protein